MHLLKLQNAYYKRADIIEYYFEREGNASTPVGSPISLK